MAFIECVPPLTGGITKLTLLNAPLRSLVTVDGLTVRATPSIVNVIGLKGEKPEPLMIMLSPTPPVAGLTLILGPVVKLVTAEFPIPSVAWTTLMPPGIEGMAKVQLKLPVAVVGIGEGLVVLMVWVATEIITVLLAAKPVPVSPTASPTPPVAGLITILGLT